MAGFSPASTAPRTSGRRRARRAPFCAAGRRPARTRSTFSRRARLRRSGRRASARQSVAGLCCRAISPLAGGLRAPRAGEGVGGRRRGALADLETAARLSRSVSTRSRLWGAQAEKTGDKKRALDAYRKSLADLTRATPGSSAMSRSACISTSKGGTSESFLRGNAMTDAKQLPAEAMAQLFTAARTHNGWLRPRRCRTTCSNWRWITPNGGRQAPIARRCASIFVRSPEAKARLAPAMSDANRAKDHGRARHGDRRL